VTGRPGAVRKSARPAVSEPEEFGPSVDPDRATVCHRTACSSQRCQRLFRPGWWWRWSRSPGASPSGEPADGRAQFARQHRLNPRRPGLQVRLSDPHRGSAGERDLVSRAPRDLYGTDSRWYRTPDTGRPLVTVDRRWHAVVRRRRGVRAGRCAAWR